MQSPRFLAPVVCVFLTISIPSSVGFAQNPVSFNPVTSTGANPANIYAVDVNNDGLTDIIQDGGVTSFSFSVSINNGNGTFQTPVTYTLPVTPATPAYPMCIGAADYNKDGNVDLAVPLVNTNEIAVYLGKGDGTFNSPIISTINLPSGYTFSEAGCAAADFNADGNMDLVAWSTNGQQPSATTEIEVLEGEGNGSFNSSAYPVLAGPPLIPNMQIFVGDYNSDNNADIATETTIEDPSTGRPISTTMHVLFGNNNFTFDDTTPYTAEGAMTIGSGDLNSDGYTDLFALTLVNGVQQLGVFYGNSSGTFDSYFINTPYSTYPVGASPASWSWQPQFTMADYNGDGLMDLAAIAWNENHTQPYVEFFLAGANPGAFTTQVVEVPGNQDSDSTPVAGLFSGSYLTPDVTDNQAGYLIDYENLADSGWFGPCYYPRAGKGFDVCQAGTVTGSTALFSTAVDSFGKLRKIELWVDGTKVAEQHNTWDTHAYFDWAGTFSPGTHQATFFAADIDNTLQRYDFTFTVNAAN